MPAKLDRCVREVKAERKKEFKEKHGREPNKDELEEIENSAWAICRESLDV